MRIIDDDLTNETVHLRIWQPPGERLWMGKMWQERNGVQGGEVSVLEVSQQDVVRHIGGIIAVNRIGGVVE